MNDKYFVWIENKGEPKKQQPKQTASDYIVSVWKYFYNLNNNIRCEIVIIIVCIAFELVQTIPTCITMLQIFAQNRSRERRHTILFIGNRHFFPLCQFLTSPFQFIVCILLSRLQATLFFHHIII